MSLEIERKFLVEGEFRHLVKSSSHIQQGYIASGNGRTVRVRIRDRQGFLTIKGPSLDGGLSRYEFEQEIALEDALQLMRICEPGIIDKTRHLIPTPDGKHTIEVDEFYGDNEGLIMAEVELQSEDDTFTPLPFLGKEVTGNKLYYNSHMRRYPYKLWKEEEK